jgi:hypothetical protein
MILSLPTATITSLRIQALVNSPGCKGSRRWKVIARLRKIFL